VFPGSPSEPDRLHGLYCVRHKLSDINNLCKTQYYSAWVPITRMTTELGARKFRISHGR
jgi:hypothetical protein